MTVLILILPTDVPGFSLLPLTCVPSLLSLNQSANQTNVARLPLLLICIVPFTSEQKIFSYPCMSACVSAHTLYQYIIRSVGDFCFVLFISFCFELSLLHILDSNIYPNDASKHFLLNKWFHFGNFILLCSLLV